MKWMQYGLSSSCIIVGLKINWVKMVSKFLVKCDTLAWNDFGKTFWPHSLDKNSESYNVGAHYLLTRIIKHKNPLCKFRIFYWIANIVQHVLLFVQQVAPSPWFEQIPSKGGSAQVTWIYLQETPTTTSNDDTSFKSCLFSSNKEFIL